MFKTSGGNSRFSRGNQSGFSTRSAGGGGYGRGDSHSNDGNRSSGSGRASGGGFRFSKSKSFRGRNSGQSQIHPSQYIQAAQPVAEEKPYASNHTFESFGLDARLVAKVKHHGYTQPTPIQDQTIALLMAGDDVMGLANTGTGKTAAFLLPLLHKVLLDKSQGVMILAPTRELAVQIFDEFKLFSMGLPISSCLCIGGKSMDYQRRQLQQEPHFIIGTPGRLKDLMNRNAFNTSLFSNLVLDEVDRMLDIGFRPDINFITQALPTKRQTAFFSATMNKDVEAVAAALLTNPKRIQIKTLVSSQQIEQDVVEIKFGESKIEILHQLLLQTEFQKVMVFGRTKHGINKLEEVLSKRGVRVASTHGNKNQSARQRSLQAFKLGHVQALLATDVAARGIHVDDVSHVINYDEPMTYDDYIHRIGRTGRAGKYGKALTFVSRG